MTPEEKYNFRRGLSEALGNFNSAQLSAIYDEEKNLSMNGISFICAELGFHQDDVILALRTDLNFYSCVRSILNIER